MEQTGASATDWIQRWKSGAGVSWITVTSQQWAALAEECTWGLFVRKHSRHQCVRCVRPCVCHRCDTNHRAGANQQLVQIGYKRPELSGSVVSQQTSSVKRDRKRRRAVCWVRGKDGERAAPPLYLCAFINYSVVSLLSFLNPVFDPHCVVILWVWVFLFFSQGPFLGLVLPSDWIFFSSWIRPSSLKTYVHCTFNQIFWINQSEFWWLRWLIEKL